LQATNTKQRVLEAAAPGDILGAVANAPVVGEVSMELRRRPPTAFVADTDEIVIVARTTKGAAGGVATGKSRKPILVCTISRYIFIIIPIPATRRLQLLACTSVL